MSEPPVTTSLDAQAWAPDQISSYSPTDVLATAALLALSTRGGSIEGDAPSLRVPFVVDQADAEIVAEGAPIADTGAVLDEITISTHKVSKLVTVSREQAGQQDAAGQITASIRRTMTDKADSLFLAAPAPIPPAVGPTGLVGLVTTTGGTIGKTAGLWAIYDAIASLEAEGGAASHLLMHPEDFAIIAKLPDQADSNRPVLGAIGQATGRQIAGLPVVVSRFATQGKALLIDRAEIVSAYGQLQLTRSDQYAFDRDAIAIRATWRIGWGIPRPTRAGRILTVNAA